MVSAKLKILLASSRGILVNKLVLGQSNMRRVKAALSVEKPANSIACCSLIQSMHVLPVVDVAILIDEVSLGENIKRALLHQFDRFRTSQALRAKSTTDEAIAAAFLIPVEEIGPAVLGKSLYTYPIDCVCDGEDA